MEPMGFFPMEPAADVSSGSAEDMMRVVPAVCNCIQKRSWRRFVCACIAVHSTANGELARTP
jgi:hypothetical protein